MTGRPTKIMCVSEIEISYEGSDTQAKIRKCCLEHIEKQQTRWVILGGDSAPESSHVPDRDTHHTKYGYKDIPTDCYYTSDSNWDANGDGTYGKHDDDIEAVEYSNPKASIGRIPVRTPEDVLVYTRKVIDYEANYPTDEFASRLVYTCPEKHAYPKLLTSIEQISNSWQGGGASKFFASESPWDGDTPGDHDLSNSNWVKMINDRQAAKMHMHGHGFLPLWALEKRSNVTASTVEELNNSSAYPTMTTVSCFTGYFDAQQDPAITESMLRKSEGGAIAIVAPAREGVAVFHSPADFALMVSEGKLDGSTELLTRYWQHALSDAGTLGEAFNAAKKDMTPHAQKTAGYHFVQCEFNFLGDPSLDGRANTVRNIKPVVVRKEEYLLVLNVADCSICVSDGGNFYQIAQADKDGVAIVQLAEKLIYPYTISVAGPSMNTLVMQVDSEGAFREIDAGASARAATQLQL